VGRDNPKFWFKVTATSLGHTPLVFEGGLHSCTIKAALDAVENRSKMWQMKWMNTLQLYEMEDGGVLPDDPVVFINHALQRSSGYSGAYKDAVKDASKEKAKLNVHDKYNAASWCSEVHMPDTFPTVRCKEEIET